MLTIPSQINDTPKQGLDDAWRPMPATAMATPRDYFYGSPAWKRLRLLTRMRDGYRCTKCGADVSRKGAARSDHILSIEERPDLALDGDNVRTLCTRCDAQGHREKGGRGKAGRRIEHFTSRDCDAAGIPLDPNHPWRQGR